MKIRRLMVRSGLLLGAILSLALANSDNTYASLTVGSSGTAMNNSFSENTNLFPFGTNGSGQSHLSSYAIISDHGTSTYGDYVIYAPSALATLQYDYRYLSVAIDDDNDYSINATCYGGIKSSFRMEIRMRLEFSGSTVTLDNTASAATTGNICYDQNITVPSSAFSWDNDTGLYRAYFRVSLSYKYNASGSWRSTHSASHFDGKGMRHAHYWKLSNTNSFISYGKSGMGEAMATVNEHVPNGEHNNRSAKLPFGAPCSAGGNTLNNRSIVIYDSDNNISNTKDVSVIIHKQNANGSWGQLTLWPTSNSNTRPPAGNTDIATVYDAFYSSGTLSNGGKKYRFGNGKDKNAIVYLNLQPGTRYYMELTNFDSKANNFYAIGMPTDGLYGSTNFICSWDLTPKTERYNTTASVPRGSGIQFDNSVTNGKSTASTRNVWRAFMFVVGSETNVPTTGSFYSASDGTAATDGVTGNTDVSNNNKINRIYFGGAANATKAFKPLRTSSYNASAGICSRAIWQGSSPPAAGENVWHVQFQEGQRYICNTGSIDTSIMTSALLANDTVNTYNIAVGDKVCMAVSVSRPTLNAPTGQAWRYSVPACVTITTPPVSGTLTPRISASDGTIDVDVNQEVKADFNVDSDSTGPWSANGTYCSFFSSTSGPAIVPGGATCTNISLSGTGTSSVLAGSHTYTVDSTGRLGQYFCVSWGLSSPSVGVSIGTPNPDYECRLIVKKPKARILGNDARVGSAFSVTTNNKASSITGLISADANNRYGSYGEYSLLAPRAISGFGSGGGLGGGLTFANVDNLGGSSVLGNYAAASGMGTIPDVEGFLTRVSSPSPSVTNGNGSLSGNISGVHVFNGTVTVTANINITSPPSIPGSTQTVIIADHINIAPGVTRIDAWLIARGTDGTIDTCSGVGNPTASNCGDPLRINGPVMANKLLLRRAGGDKDTPAETLNLPGDAYIWMHRVSEASASLRTTYSRELPPRY